MSDFQAAYGKTSDNLLAARYAADAWVMVPCTNRDGFFVAIGLHLRGTFEDWSLASFFGNVCDVADEAAFRAHVEGELQHEREKRALNRETHRRPHSTPWGMAQHTAVYAPGVTAYSTSGHGGFFLNPDRNRLVRPVLRARDGWYEEDCAWAAIAFTFPDLFTTRERDQADRTIRDRHPDVYEAVRKVVLQPGESSEKDRRAFFARHADDWVAASAIISDHHQGFTEVFATVGGLHRQREGRRFLVPCEEYVVEQFGFVIDPVRHEAIPDDAPNSFMGRAKVG